MPWFLHDTNVRERDFGVWRFFAEVSSQYPSFEFLRQAGEWNDEQVIAMMVSSCFDGLAAK